MAKTTADLELIRDELIASRVTEVYRIAGAHHSAQIEKVAKLQSAIDAIGAVIASGADEPDDHMEPRLTIL